MSPSVKPPTEILAGYISGATVELAKVREKDGQIKLSAQGSFVSRDFSNFESILNLYLKRHKGEISHVCLGVAGPVIVNQVRTTNLPWQLNSEDIEQQFSFQRVQLLNDIVAFAYGLPGLARDRFYMLNGEGPLTGGNIGVIAAGAGLGEALIFTAGGKHNPYASEGGHAGFSPSTQLESELWQYIYSEKGFVEVEDVLSLSGLERIYSFVIDADGTSVGSWYEKAADKPSAIVEKALSGNDKYASTTLDIFIDCLASEASNLALKGMTLGGVYFGGLIVPRIITLLDGGKFMNRFVRPGKMESILARLPVGVVIEDKTALLGAAAVALRM